MYCKKCGKFIYSDDDYCSDCAPAATPTPEPVVITEPVVTPTPVVTPISEPAFAPSVNPVQTKRQGRVMDGFGPALTSVILSIVAYVFTFIGYIYAIVGTDTESELVVAGIVMAVIGVGFAIPSLILGIKSIKCFRYAVANKRVKPIPALVLGIYGTAMSGTSFIHIGIVFIFALALLA